jgi:hypothetical protein
MQTKIGLNPWGVGKDRQKRALTHQNRFLQIKTVRNQLKSAKNRLKQAKTFKTS